MNMKGSFGELGLSGESDSSCDDVDSSTGSEWCSDDQNRCIYANLEVTVKKFVGKTSFAYIRFLYIMPKYIVVRQDVVECHNK